MAVPRWSTGKPVTSRSSKRIRPDVGWINPAISRSSVVLPQPLGPSRKKNSPDATVADTLDNAGFDEEAPSYTFVKASSAISIYVPTTAVRAALKERPGRPQSAFMCEIPYQAVFRATDWQFPLSRPVK